MCLCGVVKSTSEFKTSYNILMNIIINGLGSLVKIYEHVLLFTLLHKKSSTPEKYS